MKRHFCDGLVQETIQVGVPCCELVSVEADLGLYVVHDAQLHGQLTEIGCGGQASTPGVAMDHPQSAHFSSALSTAERLMPVARMMSAVVGE